MIFKTNKKLREEVAELNRIIKVFIKDKDGLLIDLIKERNKVGSTKAVIDRVTNNGISWFDYEKLSPQDLRQYHGDAQLLLENRVFKNEFNRIVKESMVWALKESPDFEAVRDMRMNVNGLQLLKDRAENIPNPDKKVSTENIHEAI